MDNERLFGHIETLQCEIEDEASRFWHEDEAASEALNEPLRAAAYRLWGEKKGERRFQLAYSEGR